MITKLGVNEEDVKESYLHLYKCCLTVLLASASNYPSMRTCGLVDYDDDDEFNPPPRENLDKSTEDDEEIAESFLLKRKLASKDEPERKKLCWQPKLSKPNELYLLHCAQP
ncbi:OLC1v1016287C1 [Oldenlandia corymbosa var. corymbosa]|nr:OLC1v1016287C1 [Oldenlandia corymbosa var. corymbosa]